MPTQPIAHAPLAADPLSDPEALLQRLQRRAGRYAGQGVDDGGHPYRAELEVRPLLGRGVEARFTARAQDSGDCFHEECLWIARDGLSGLAAWILTSAAVGVERLELVAASVSKVSSDDVALHFAVGDPSDTTSYRAALRIVMRARGALELVWSSGLPGSEFAERSGLRLRPLV